MTFLSAIIPYDRRTALSTRNIILLVKFTPSKIASSTAVKTQTRNRIEKITDAKKRRLSRARANRDRHRRTCTANFWSRLGTVRVEIIRTLSMFDEMSGFVRLGARVIRKQQKPNRNRIFARCRILNCYTQSIRAYVYNTIMISKANV